MRKTKLAEAEYYHLYNRGVDKRVIFEDAEDYARFLICLFLANNNKSFNISDLIKRGKDFGELFLKERETIISIHAYCLMPNHFHLMVSEKTSGGISTFMQKLATAYTMYFNKKNNRTGALFQGTFKSEHIATDEYLHYLFAYIHTNPFSVVRNGKISISDAEVVLNYPYSSITEYLGIQRPEKAIVESPVFIKEFGGKKSLLKQLRMWLDYHGTDGSISLS